MTGTGDFFDFVKVIRFGGLVAAVMLFAELEGERFVRRSEVLADDFFGDVATDVFAVVAFLFDFGFFGFGFENGNLLTLGLIWIGSEVKDQGSLFIDGSVDEFAEKRIIGSGSLDVQKHFQLEVVEVLV